MASVTVPPTISAQMREKYQLTLDTSVQVIAEAKESLLALEDDWDGEGAPAYSEQTIEAAAAFFYQLVERSELATPVRILPASEGSIDLHWKTAQFELLINFHPDGSVSYYRDDYCENAIQGKTRPKPEVIACWMEHIY